MNYFFSVAGLLIAVEHPFHVEFSAKDLPFLQSSSHREPDLTVCFVERPSIPQPADGAANYGWTRYESTAQERVSYWYMPQANTPYARTIYHSQQPKSLRCEYLTGSEINFPFSSSILNLISLESILLRNDGILLHSSLIRVHDKAILFAGPSGIGKSTQASLWQTYHQAELINGDRAALRQIGDIWTAWGLPYAGTSGIFRNESAPVRALVVLRQADCNRLRRLSSSEALRMAYPELTLHRWEPQEVDLALTNFLKFVQTTPVYLLECLPDRGAVELLYQNLFQEGSP